MSSPKQWDKMVKDDTERIFLALSHRKGETFKKSDIRATFQLAFVKSYDVFDRLGDKGFIIERGYITVPL